MSKKSDNTKPPKAPEAPINETASPETPPPTEPTVGGSTENKIVPKKTSRMLQCMLTDADRIARGRDMADEKDAKDRLESQMSEVSKDFKAKIAAKDTRISSLASVIRAGYEYREVPCEIYLDTPAPGMKTIFRIDTGEMVERTEMTDTEKQTLMPFPGLEVVD